jgi:flagellar biosynthesis/type III secretory pathway chaperone
MRKIEEVNQEYTAICSRVGDMAFRSKQLMERLQELNREANEIVQATKEAADATSAEQQPASEAAVPAN